MHGLGDIDFIVIQPLVALIFGVLILMLPRLLNYLVAIYLIFIGAVGLWPHFMHHIKYRLSTASRRCANGRGGAGFCHALLGDPVGDGVRRLALRIGAAEDLR